MGLSSEVLRRSWPYLASAGVNGALIALLVYLPQKSPPFEQDSPDIIPVTLVEQAGQLPDRSDSVQAAEHEPEPPPHPEPEPLPPRRAPPAGAGPSQQNADVQSPLIAAPDETADAAPMADNGDDIPELDLPVFAGREKRTRDALRALSCNRLGKERPSWCDQEDESRPRDILEAAAKPEFAQNPTLAPKKWAALERPERDEWCPDSDGVIKDAIVENKNPNLQGAASMVGTLGSSVADSC